MTVAELIEKLAELPQDAPAMTVAGYSTVFGGNPPEEIEAVKLLNGAACLSADGWLLDNWKSEYA